LDIRYRGQGYELNVPYDPVFPDNTISAFYRLHRERYGFSHTNKPVEIVNLRLRIVASGEAYTPSQDALMRNDGENACVSERPIFFDGQPLLSKIYDRSLLLPGALLHGPALITEYTSATLLPPACYAQVDGFGNLVLTVSEARP
jgi:N-methylhydantoinase A